jgi:hypothetical protein
MFLFESAVELTGGITGRQFFKTRASVAELLRGYLYSSHGD